AKGEFLPAWSSSPLLVFPLPQVTELLLPYKQEHNPPPELPVRPMPPFGWRAAHTGCTSCPASQFAKHFAGRCTAIGVHRPAKCCAPHTNCTASPCREVSKKLRIRGQACGILLGGRLPSVVCMG